MVQGEEILESHQLYDRVLACIDRLESGIWCRLILELLVFLIHNKMLDLVHVGFIHIYFPQFLTDELFDVLLFEVVHLCVSLGKLNTRVRDDC